MASDGTDLNLTSAGAGYVKVSTGLASKSGPLNLMSASGQNVALGMAGAGYWIVQASTGTLYPASAYNIGSSGHPVNTAYAKSAQLIAYTVATLPACGAGTDGLLAYVSDALSPSYNATLAGGSSIKTLALCNGSAWTAH
jgi:hypothetical protein